MGEQTQTQYSKHEYEYNDTQTRTHDPDMSPLSVPPSSPSPSSSPLSAPPSSISSFDSFFSHPPVYFLWFVLAFVQLCWSGFHITSSFTMRYIDSFCLPGFRSFIASPCLYALCRLLYPVDRLVLPRCQWRPALTAALLGGCIGPQLFNVGLRLSTAIDGGLSQPLIPVWTTLFAFLARSETIGKRKCVAIAVSVSGSLFIVVSEALSTSAINTAVSVSTASRVCGFMCFLLQTALFSQFVIIQKRILNDTNIPPLALTMFIFLIAGVPNCLIAIGGALFTDWPAVPALAWGGVIYLGLMGTVVAFGGFAYASAHLPASSAAMIISLAPFFTTLLDCMFLDEPLTVADIIGGLAIVSGLLMLIHAKKIEDQQNNTDAIEKAAAAGFVVEEGDLQQTSLMMKSTEAELISAGQSHLSSPSPSLIANDEPLMIES